MIFKTEKKMLKINLSPAQIILSLVLIREQEQQNYCSMIKILKKNFNKNKFLNYFLKKIKYQTYNSLIKFQKNQFKMIFLKVQELL